MIITLQLHDTTYTVASPKDPDASDMALMFRGLLVQAGFHPVTVEALFDVNAVETWDLCPDESDQPPEEKEGVWSWHVPGENKFTPTEISTEQYEQDSDSDKG